MWSGPCETQPSPLTSVNLANHLGCSFGQIQVVQLRNLEIAHRGGIRTRQRLAIQNFTQEIDYDKVKLHSPGAVVKDAINHLADALRRNFQASLLFDLPHNGGLQSLSKLNRTTGDGPFSLGRGFASLDQEN
jgi:hypothetical protein